MEKYIINKNELNAYYAYPENKNGQGILVLHAWWGLNKFIKEFSDRLAGEGFLVLAPDLYKGKVANNIKDAEKLRSTVQRKEINPILKELVNILLSNPNCNGSKLSVIGFSLGASWASWLANNKPKEIEKVVLYYGIGAGNFLKTQALFQCHFAENDLYTKSNQVEYFKERLQNANIKAIHYSYPNTSHWFFESDKPLYFNEESSKIAWKRTLDFLIS